MRPTSIILLGASVAVAAASGESQPKVKLINRRDAVPIPDVFMNAIQAVPALRKRELGPPTYYASAPEGVRKRSSLESRQWGCETVGQINCVFEGCCNVGTICGVYGGQTGCCPIGKTCTGVGSCKTGETICGSGCCPSNASCTSNADGSAACDYGTGSSSTRTLMRPTATSARLSSTSTSTSLPGSGSECPAGYSPCADTDTCCPAGVKCLPNKKCDSKCSVSDIKCGTGCCKGGFTCDTATFICQGNGSDSSDDSGDSGSGTSSGGTRSTVSFTRFTATANSGSSSGTTSRSSVPTGITASDGGANSGPRLIAGMGMAGIIAGVVAIVGVALL
ncbi:unnamed protein product [Tuber melanosporum]|jgi:hypothetical protein|uniref:(Perigord truffle) hypothetical protein n=1 Tax=Tuber melanosporum (strain Mel28) TaxID=656061 RepID=D5GBA3_TUBMM|nr:uncharacterized protein GSTUM_00000537001 [Tuber melanosporum]CAZ81796.1 unnamed protein product [Tuber melanosporum]